MGKDPIVVIPAKTLSHAEVVSIRLDVKSTHAKTEATTNIHLNVRPVVEVNLMCIRNCKFFNPGDEIIFECNYKFQGEPGPVEDIQWFWHPKDELFPTAVQDEPYRISIILPPPGGIIKPRALECIVTPKSLQPMSAKTENFQINIPPIPSTALPGGPCTVAPTSGTFLETTFNVSCISFVDDMLPLKYNYFVELDNASAYSAVLNKLDNRLLLAYDTNPTAEELYLPFGDTSGNTVNIVVQVTDSLGLSQETKIPVTVDLSTTSDYNLLYRDLIFGDEPVMGKRFLRGDYQGAIQLQAVALYGLQAPTINQSFTQEEIETILNVMERQEGKIPQHNFESNKQMVYVEHLLDHLENRTDPDTLLGISRPLHDASSNLVNFAKNSHEVTSSKELELLAE